MGAKPPLKSVEATPLNRSPSTVSLLSGAGERMIDEQPQEFTDKQAFAFDQPASTEISLDPHLSLTLYRAALAAPFRISSDLAIVMRSKTSSSSGICLAPFGRIAAEFLC
jgi:hypothetical protein